MQTSALNSDTFRCRQLGGYQMVGVLADLSTGYPFRERIEALPAGEGNCSVVQIKDVRAGGDRRLRDVEGNTDEQGDADSETSASIGAAAEWELARSVGVVEWIAGSAATLDRVKLHTAARGFVDGPKQTGRQGDVLLLSRGQRPFAVAVAEDLGECVAASYFHILRPRPGVTSDYLAFVINHPRTQETLAGLLRGSHMPFVPLSELATLEVPVPPLDKQAAFVNLARLAAREQVLLARQAAARRTLLTGLCDPYA